MKWTSIALAGILALAMAALGRAQPTLDRVEQQLRRQVLSPQPPVAAPNAAEPGYLGVIADDRQEQGGGVRVLEVIAEGPAAKGGVQTGDLITAINGQPVRLMDEMARALERQLAGAKLSITVNRQGADRQLEVTLGRRPPARPIGRIPDELPRPAAAPADEAPARGPRLGVRTVRVTEDVRRQYGLSDTSGAMVVSVTAGSLADRAGVPLGVVITALDGKPIDTPQDLADAVGRAGARQVELTYLNRGRTTRKHILLAAHDLPSDSPKLELRGRPDSNSSRLVFPGNKLEGPEIPEPSEGPAVQPSPTAALEARIRELEERIEKLEAALAGDKQ